MTTRIRGIAKVILSIFITIAIYSILPKTTYAQCCGAGDCGGGGVCIGAPALCPDSGSGTCVSGYETCSGSNNSSACGSGECCGGNGLCTTSCGSSCFPAGTGITLADGTKKNIEDVEVGDSVLSQDMSGNKTESKVEKLIQPVSDNMCTIDFDNSEKLEVTKSHPFLTNNGWKAIDKESALLEKPGVEVNSLMVGDLLYKQDGSNPKVTAISCRSEKVQTYNFTVDNSHTYFANGYLAHNKGGQADCTDFSASCDLAAGYTVATHIIASETVCGQSNFCGNLGNAQAPGDCCGGGQYDENGVFTCRRSVITYACCPPGTQETPNTVYGGLYTIYNVSCHLQTTTSSNPLYVCGDADDIIVSVQRGAANSTCYCGGEGCRANCCDNTEWVYNDVVTCQSVTTTWSCQPTCTPASPSKPQLLSPSDGSSVSTTNISLIWNTLNQTWGTNCTSNNNQYEVYVGTDQSNLGLLGVAGSGTGSASFSGTSGNTYYWKVRAKNGSADTDSDIWSFTINNGPWWQAKDGDLTTNNDITSIVPTGKLFDIVGLGGFPGVPVYGGTLTVGSGEISGSPWNWNANTLNYQSRIFNYSYFSNLIPNDVVFNNVSDLATGGSSYSDGYEWFKATGDVSSVGDINIGNRKVILFVENGNLNINGKINVTDGVGFFGAFVDGNIIVDSTVTGTGTPALEGIYLSGGTFSTGTSGSGDSQLHIRGSVASFGGINLQRNLTNNANPAELFEFAPDQMLLFPEKLMYRRSKWQEIAP